MKNRSLQITNTRRAAFQIVSSVIDKQISLDQTLEKAFSSTASWDARDRAFIKNLTTTLFRRLAGIDGAIFLFLERPLPLKARWVMHWLRIGAVQILFMDVADHAAVNTSVTGVAKEQKPGAIAYKRLVNAVLRNICRNKTRIINDIENDTTKNIPEWLVKRWLKTYGENISNQILISQLTLPPLDITLKDPRKAHELGGEEIFHGTLRLKSAGRIEEIPGFKEGDWWAQDLAASLPPRLFGDLKGKTVLDLCAAPGGKTLYLASRGANVTAIDLSELRIARLKENLSRANLTAKVIKTDVLSFKPEKKFKYIVLDAPCSSTGTLRRHPDVPYHRKEKDILRLTKVQKDMLSHSFSLLESGGILIYCVCSLEMEEGEQLVNMFLDENPKARRVPIHISEIENHGEWINKNGDLRTLPCHMKTKGGMDGFFIARLTKN